MEMQQRKLDYRPTWDINLTQHIAGNYYPVNSAIAIRCTDGKAYPQQATVMTERSTAGSAHLTSGRVELLHNRRLLCDDNRGVGQALNETDADGNGITVSTKYFIDFAEAAVSENEVTTMYSNQRPKQLEIDQPLQYFWSFSHVNWWDHDTHGA